MKLNNDKSKKDFKKEIDVLRKMKDSKNSVKFFSHFDDKENEILILEFCECDLQTIIEKNNKLNINQIFILLNKLMKVLNICKVKI